MLSLILTILAIVFIILNFLIFELYPLYCLSFALFIFATVLYKRGANMIFGVITMSAFTMFLLAAGFPADDFNAIGLFRQPVFIVTCALMSFSMVHICFKMPLNLKKMPFHFTHLGVATLLLGALIGMLLEVSPPQFDMLIGEDFVYHQMYLEQKEQPRGMHQSAPPSVELPFGIAIKSFEVEKYPSTSYNVFKQEEVKGPYGQMTKDYVWKAMVKIEEGFLKHDLFEPIPEKKLLDHGQGKLPLQYVPGENLIIQLIKPMDKAYKAVFRIYHDDTREKFTDFDWTVNKPVDWEGWRFYLMSYKSAERNDPWGGRGSQPRVSISARKDPGLPFVKAGIYMILFGTFTLCLFRKGKNKEKELTND